MIEKIYISTLTVITIILGCSSIKTNQRLISNNVEYQKVLDSLAVRITDCEFRYDDIVNRYKEAGELIEQLLQDIDECEISKEP